MKIIRGDAGPTKFFSLVFKADNEVISSGDTNVFLGYQVSNSDNEKPDGIWAKWQWDGRQIVVSNDIFGMYPLFYFFNENAFYVSNSIDKILQLGADSTVDYLALSVFLRLGYYVKNDTPFKYIKAVPPGTNIIVKDRKLIIEKQVASNGNIASVASRKQALKDYCELFECALKDLAPSDIDKVGLPLSGGRDSRHILFGLLSIGFSNFECVTSRHPAPLSQEDADIAKMITREVNLPHTVVPEIYHSCETVIKNIIATNYCADDHFWVPPLSEYVFNKFNLIYDGIGGDVLSNGLFLNREYLSLYESNSLGELAHNMLKMGETISNCLQPQTQKKLSLDYAIDYLIPELARHSMENNPIGQFIFWNRTRRETSLSPWAMLGKRTHAFAPYLHHDVYQFLRSLPASYLVNQDFHDDAIAQRYPQYANLPYAPKRTNTNTIYKKYTPVREAFNVFRYVCDDSGKINLNKLRLLNYMVRMHLRRPLGWQLPLKTFQEIYLKTIGSV